MSGTTSLFRECAEVFGKLAQSRVGEHGHGPIIAGRIPSRPIAMYLTKYPNAPRKNYFALMALGSSEPVKVYADPTAHGHKPEETITRTIIGKVRDILRGIEMRL